MKYFTTIIFLCLSALASASLRDDFEEITQVQLPKARTNNLRKLENYDVETAKNIVLQAARMMHNDRQGRKLHWGFCWTFWNCDHETSVTVDDLKYTVDDMLKYGETAFDNFVETLAESESLDDLQAAIRRWSSFDVRFDLYTYIISLTNSIEVKNWEERYQPNGRPNAKEHVTKPVGKQRDIEGVECGLAYNPDVDAVIVPKNDEHFQDVERANILLSFGIAENLGFPLRADQCGNWKEGENRIHAIKSRLFDSFPYHRKITNYPADQQSDEALEHMVFRSIGQHRIQRVKKDDPFAPANSYYAVYLSVVQNLEVRPGFAKLGATAYFDSNGAVVMIERGGKKYYPNGVQGNEYIPAVPEKCTTSWVWNWWPRRVTKCCCGKAAVPATFGWLNAKLAFRATLSAVVTALDHLHGLHLSVANAIVTANVEEVDSDHFLRLLLTPFGYRTEAINYRASFALVNEFGLLHRATPFTKKGLIDLFEFGRTASAGLTWATIPQRKAAKGVDTMVLPIDEDGTDYYNVLKAYVKKYFDLHAPSDCSKDPQIQRWMKRANSISPNHDLPTEYTCDSLVDIISTFMYLVSSGHRHVGTIAAELEDPCFAPWSFRETELCGMPRTVYTQILTMALTSHEQPRIVEDYSHMWDDVESKNLWRELTENLEKLEGRVNERNKRRQSPYNVFLPSQIETAVGI